MKRIPVLTLTILSLILYSCVEITPTIYEYKQLVVKNKTVDLHQGTTRYNIAFTSGESEEFSFGLYSKYEIDDTVCFKREKGWIWYVTSCK